MEIWSAGVSSKTIVVEKIMTLTREEFDRSLAKINSSLSLPPSDAPVRITFSGGAVTISFETLPSETVGSLLTLPRARVLLTFDGLNADEQGVFLKQFDQTFQRGGG